MAHASPFWQCLQTALCLAACTACVQAVTRPAVVVATTAASASAGGDGANRVGDLPLLEMARA